VMAEEGKEARKTYVVNCAGQRVAVDQETYTSRCAIGNTDDYLVAFKKYVNAKLVSLGEPAPLSIVIPSYKSDIKGICRTLRSLLSQKYGQNVEILVFINEPPNASNEAKATNDRTEALIESLVRNETRDLSQARREQSCMKQVLKLAAKKKHIVRFTHVRKTIDGGTADVYQTAVASYVARLRKFCDGIAGTDRAEKLRKNGRYFHDNCSE